MSGSCVYTGCVGVHVPGDYSTIMGAAAALASAGGTICLDGTSYSETVDIGEGGGVQVNGPLTIQGTSADAVTIAKLELDEPPGPFVLRGVAVTQESFVGSAQSQTIDFEGCAFPGGLSVGTLGAVSLKASTVDTIFSAIGNVTVDQSVIYEGINFGGTCGDAGAIPPIVVRNSYVNGSFAGAVISEDGLPDCPTTNTFPYANVYLLNDTFVANLNAIVVQTGDTHVGIYGINNIFVGDTDGGTAITVSAQISNDLVFAYSAHYGSGELPQPNTLFADPLFDTATPPGLLAGSPALGAGTASYTPPALGMELDAPTVDYWGRPRDPNHIDLGAVQTSP